MKRLSLVGLIMLIISAGSLAQTRSTGYLYTFQTGSKEKFQYSVATTFSDGSYKTVYKLFKPGSSKNRYTITASHLKDSKKIVVEVNDEQYLLSAMDGKEETQYDIPTVKPFGFRGDLALFDKSAPNQLAVQFISNRFQYVKVLSFLGSHSDGIFQFFIFNQNDKVIVSKEDGGTNKTGINNNSKPKAILGRTLTSDSSAAKSIWFSGTKSFCDESNLWKYEVTIKGDSIVLKGLPGKSNNYYKDKGKPVEIVKGILKYGKIITKDAPEYLTNRFKYEKGVLYEVNNEGDFNDYRECK